ncbi:MAG: hypothetical protein HZA35_03210 [Parcubacteria group bacterium]|nr:hypothetical protein [Parcubacteria group bacterium]
MPNFNGPPTNKGPFSVEPKPVEELVKKTPEIKMGKPRTEREIQQEMDIMSEYYRNDKNTYRVLGDLRSVIADLRNMDNPSFVDSEEARMDRKDSDYFKEVRSGYKGWKSEDFMKFADKLQKILDEKEKEQERIMKEQAAEAASYEYRRGKAERSLGSVRYKLDNGEWPERKDVEESLWFLKDDNWKRREKYFNGDSHDDYQSEMSSLRSDLDSPNEIVRTYASEQISGLEERAREHQKKAEEIKRFEDVIAVSKQVEALLGVSWIEKDVVGKDEKVFLKGLLDTLQKPDVFVGLGQDDIQRAVKILKDSPKYTATNNFREELNEVEGDLKKESDGSIVKKTLEIRKQELLKKIGREGLDDYEYGEVSKSIKILESFLEKSEK